MNKKIQCLRSKMGAVDLHGFVIANPQNISYLTNIKAEGVLLLTRKDNIFITDSRYIEEVNKVLTLYDEITVYDQKDLSIDDYSNFFMYCENVGFEENYLTYEKYKEYIRKYKINSFVETEYLIEKERIIKDEEEIENIRKSCEITDNCFQYLLKTIRKGMTEKDIAKLILNFFYDNSDGISFEPIVASGKNSSIPHATPTNRVITSGDIITIDMGCKYKGYCSDMTRTIFIDECDLSYRYIYDIVLEAQEKSILEMKNNANIKNIVQNVENSFKQKGYYQKHALGHGVGLDVHEGPTLSLRSSPNSILKENMIVTSEPGIYLPGKFGIRIEDTLRINQEGSECLTKSPKEIIVI